MTDAVQIALIATAGPTLVGIVTAVISWRNAQKLEVVHKATNSLVQTRVDAEKALSHSEGMAAQKDLDNPK